MGHLSREELARWSEEEILAAKGGATPEHDFAQIADWGADRAEADVEAQRIARELGIGEEIVLSFENPADAGGVSGWWNPEQRALGINEAVWNRDRGWKRFETIAHEVMHAHQTLCHDDWKPGWDRYVKLAAAANDADVERGSEEFWRRQWAYRHDPLEDEALAFGREYRDRRRARHDDSSSTTDKGAA